MFTKINIKRGQKRGNDSGNFLKDLFNFSKKAKLDEFGDVIEESTEQDCGYFKGIVEVFNEAEQKDYVQLLQRKSHRLMNVLRKRINECCDCEHKMAFDSFEMDSLE